MKKFLWFVILIAILFVLNPKVTLAESPVAVSCQACILMDAESGRVLFEKNIHRQMRIASITKIMTALIAIEEGVLDEYVTISEEATKQIGSSLYVKAGEQLKLIDLIYGLMLRSGNDAAYAIAEHIAGDYDTFVLWMNERAKQIGMYNTVFENPSGLDETTSNLSTAYDMARLMRVALQNPIFQTISSSKTHRATSKAGQVYVFHNKHRLVNSYDYITGGKTGYTKKAGRTLVTSAKKNGMELIVVTLDDPNDWADHLRLFEYGFTHFKPRYLLDRGILYVKELDRLFYLDEALRVPLSEEEAKHAELVIDRVNDAYYLRLVHGETILLSRSLKDYNHLHDDPIKSWKDVFWSIIGGYND
ncbi:MAG TPA: D-alanyl-D-alanine carboxypeptidase family protein [Haloplasmataceae bacterium]